MLAATAVRMAAEPLPKYYFEALTLASALWLLFAVVWGLFLVPKVAKKP